MGTNFFGISEYNTKWNALLIKSYICLKLIIQEAQFE